MARNAKWRGVLLSRIDTVLPSLSSDRFNLIFRRQSERTVRRLFYTKLDRHTFARHSFTVNAFWWRPQIKSGFVARKPNPILKCQNKDLGPTNWNLIWNVSRFATRTPTKAIHKQKLNLPTDVCAYVFPYEIRQTSAYNHSSVVMRW